MPCGPLSPAPREIVSGMRRESPRSGLKPMVRLETERLLLRDFAPDDWPALHAVESRGDVARYQSFEPRTPEESRAYVTAASEDATQASRETYDLAVILVAENLLIGRCGLGLTNPDLGEAMLWYTIHPSYWGQGYATEAAHRLLAFGFDELRLHRIWADCDPANSASVRVLVKLGLARSPPDRKRVDQRRLG